MKTTLILATAAALLTPTLASPTPASVDTSSLLEARATVFQSLNCKRVKGHGDYGVIVNQGLTGLLFKSGKPSSAAGKTGVPTCNRVFCDVESNSGIFWCNSVRPPPLPPFGLSVVLTWGAEYQGAYPRLVRRYRGWRDADCDGPDVPGGVAGEYE